MDSYKNPLPAVDAVIFYKDTESVIVIDRKNPPHGKALPGGFVNEGESLEDAVKREVKEELGVDFVPYTQLFTYSDPKRDPRRHVTSTVYIGYTNDEPKAADDAAGAHVMSLFELVERDDIPLAFDHKKILKDAARWLLDGDRRELESQ